MSLSPITGLQTQVPVLAQSTLSAQPTVAAVPVTTGLSTTATPVTTGLATAATPVATATPQLQNGSLTQSLMSLSQGLSTVASMANTQPAFGSSMQQQMDAMLSQLTALMNASSASVNASASPFSSALSGLAIPQTSTGVAVPATTGVSVATPVAVAASPVGVVAADRSSGDANADAKLNTALSKISQDPEGSKLLEAAKAKGYTIRVGDAKAAGSQDKDDHAHDNGNTQVNGVTISSGNRKEIVIDPNAPDFEKTLAHELVHAATDGDGDSKDEEGKAEVIGTRIAARVNNTATPNAQQVYANKKLLYGDLQESNGVSNSLAQLGIQA